MKQSQQKCPVHAPKACLTSDDLFGKAPLRLLRSAESVQLLQEVSKEHALPTNDLTLIRLFSPWIPDHGIRQGLPKRFAAGQTCRPMTHIDIGLFFECTHCHLGAARLHAS